MAFGETAPLGWFEVRVDEKRRLQLPAAMATHLERGGFTALRIEAGAGGEWRLHPMEVLPGADGAIDGSNRVLLPRNTGLEGALCNLAFDSRHGCYRLWRQQTDSRENYAP